MGGGQQPQLPFDRRGKSALFIKVPLKLDNCINQRDSFKILSKTFKKNLMPNVSQFSRYLQKIEIKWQLVEGISRS